MVEHRLFGFSYASKFASQCVGILGKYAGARTLRFVDQAETCNGALAFSIGYDRNTLDTRDGEQSCAFRVAVRTKHGYVTGFLLNTFIRRTIDLKALKGYVAAQLNPALWYDLFDKCIAKADPGYLTTLGAERKPENDQSDE